MANVRSEQPWPRVILHLDMDAFFVNVHLLAQPEDAGQPLVVGGRPEHRGVVASASYEARGFGVRSAMPTARALRLCPQLKIVGHDWPLIKQCSRQVMALLESYGPVEQMSVDEAYVDLTGRPEPEELAQAIRQRVKTETGLPASVGLATSKLVAKVASDFLKPEGCTIVRPGQEAAFLAPLPVRVIWGIGPRTAERLAAMGIQHCGQLAAADPAQLRAQFGKQAESLPLRARGIDDRPVVAEQGLPKSISQEWTFSEDIADPQQLQEWLERMSAGVAESLQKRNLLAYTVRVKFRWADFTTFTRQRSLEVGTDDAGRIYQLTLALWQENWSPGQKMRLLGVAVSGLEKAQLRQTSFDF
jgi:DNA polymerase IV